MMEYHEGSNNFFANVCARTNEWLVEEVIDEQLFQPVYFLLIVTLSPTIDTIVMKFQSQCNQFDKIPCGGFTVRFHCPTFISIVIEFKSLYDV